jgi:hypothetical protein
MLGCREEWWLWGIYNPNHQNGRWGTLLSTGAPNSLVVHRTGPVHYPVRHLAPALTLRAQSALFTIHCSLLQSTVGDSPVLHWTVR